MQCLIATFPHILQSTAKYRIMWEQDARGDNKQTRTGQCSIKPLNEYPLGVPTTIKSNRDYPCFSVCYETMMVLYEVRITSLYHMYVHSQDMMMIVANLAGSLSFLRRLDSDECWEVLMSTVSSSGNNRQRASPTEGSTSWIIEQITTSYHQSHWIHYHMKHGSW